MAFAWSTIKTESLDSFGNSLKIKGSNTGTGVVLKVLIERTQTVGGKTTTSELTSTTFFIPNETVSSLGSMTLTTLLTSAQGTTRTVKASQVTKGTIYIEYSTAKIEIKGKTSDQFSFEMSAFFIPQATIAASDISGGKYFNDEVWDAFPVREQRFTPGATGLYTATLAATPSVNANTQSGRNVLGVFEIVAGAGGTFRKRFVSGTPAAADQYDMPASNQVRAYMSSPVSWLEVVYLT